MGIRERRIIKKASNVLDKLNISMYDEDVIDVIVKEFGNVDFTYNGNNLLHIFANTNTNYYCYSMIFSALINYAGLAVNSKNKEGKNFFQVLCSNDVDINQILEYIFSKYFPKMLDLNSRDNQGYNILGNIILNENYYNNIEFRKMISLISSLFDKGCDDVRIFDDSDLTIYEWIHKNHVELEDKIYKNSDINKDSISDLLDDAYNSIRESYYKNNVYSLTKLFCENSEDNIKFVRNIFSGMLSNHNDDINELNLLSRLHEKKMDAKEEEYILAVNKLFDMGLNPNSPSGFEHRNFISTAIDAGFDFDYIYKITEIALNKGLNFKDTLSPLSELLSKTSEFNLMKMYVLLSKYGYDNLKFDVIVSSTMKNKYELFFNIRKYGFVKMFDEEASKTSLVFDECLNFNKIYFKHKLTEQENDFFKLIFEVIDWLKISNSNYNDYAFVKQIISIMVEERKNSIVNYKVEPKEILKILKEITSKYIDDSYNKILKKRG